MHLFLYILEVLIILIVFGLVMTAIYGLLASIIEEQVGNKEKHEGLKNLSFKICFALWAVFCTIGLVALN
jgi:hypothetical protein